MYTIYYIYHNEILLYVGSTTDFNNRKSNHKSDCYNENDKDYNLKLYQYIRDNDIIFEDLIWKTEETNIIDTTEALKYEGSKIIELQPICNCRVAGRSKKEYYENNKEWINEYKKQWYENNKETILEKKRLRYQMNKNKNFQ